MFLQWLSNLPWVRYIRRYPTVYADMIIATAQVEELEAKVRELDAALVARSNNESSMAQVLRGIDQRVNSSGYKQRPPTLRRRPGESDEDLMKRYEGNA